MKYFSDRLKNARKMSGLSLQDLSDRLHHSISKQDLNRLELGIMQPDSEILAQLSSALNVSLDFFFKENTVALEHVEFRKLQKLPAKKQEKVKTCTVEYLERYFELENLLGLNYELPFKPKKFKVSHQQSIEGAAIKMREEILNIGNDPISNIFELLEEHHIKVFPTIEDPAFSGMSTIINKKIGVIVFNDHPEIPLVRKRFTLLHELAHLFLDLECIEEKQSEKYCDAFACAMLLPGDKIKEYFGGKRIKVFTNELKIIKQYYGISLPAIMYRAKAFDLITPHYLKFFMINYNRYYKKEEMHGYDGKEHSSRFIQLLIRAVAQEIITSSKAASLNNQVLGDFREQFLDNAVK